MSEIKLTAAKASVQILLDYAHNASLGLPTNPEGKEVFSSARRSKDGVLLTVAAINPLAFVGSLFTGKCCSTINLINNRFGESLKEILFLDAKTRKSMIGDYAPLVVGDMFSDELERRYDLAALESPNIGKLSCFMKDEKRDANLACLSYLNENLDGIPVGSYKSMGRLLNAILTLHRTRGSSFHGLNKDSVVAAVADATTRAVNGKLGFFLSSEMFSTLSGIYNPSFTVDKTPSLKLLDNLFGGIQNYQELRSLYHQHGDAPNTSVLVQESLNNIYSSGNLNEKLFFLSKPVAPSSSDLQFLSKLYN